MCPAESPTLLLNMSFLKINPVLELVWLWEEVIKMPKPAPSILSMLTLLMCTFARVPLDFRNKKECGE